MRTWCGRQREGLKRDVHESGRNAGGSCCGLKKFARPDASEKVAEMFNVVHGSIPIYCASGKLEGTVYLWRVRKSGSRDVGQIYI